MRERISQAVRALLVGLPLMAGGAQAETLVGGFPACITEELFDEIIQVAVNHDQRGWIIC